MGTYACFKCTYIVYLEFLKGSVSSNFSLATITIYFEKKNISKLTYKGTIHYPYYYYTGLHFTNKRNCFYDSKYI